MRDEGKPLCFILHPSSLIPPREGSGVRAFFIFRSCLMPIFDTHAWLEGYQLPGVNQNAAQVMQTLQARGVTQAVLMSARAAQADPLSGNRILKAMLEQGQGLYGCLVAHLNRVDASLQAIRDLMSGK